MTESSKYKLIDESGDGFHYSWNNLNLQSFNSAWRKVWFLRHFADVFPPETLLCYNGWHRVACLIDQILNGPHYGWESLSF